VASIDGATSIGRGIEITYGSVVNMYDGTAGKETLLLDNAVYNVYGGHVGDLIDVVDSTLNLYGGYLGYRVSSHEGSEVNIFGGEIATGEYTRPASLDWRGHFAVWDGGVANIHGGVFGQTIYVDAEGELNLFVQELSINDEPIPLTPGIRTVIPVTRDKLLTAVLADGTFFELDLTSGDDIIGDYIHLESLLTATMVVPEPSAWLLAVFAVVGVTWFYKCT
jgi:hypothetical protein